MAALHSGVAGPGILRHSHGYWETKTEPSLMLLITHLPFQMLYTFYPQRAIIIINIILIIIIIWVIFLTLH